MTANTRRSDEARVQEAHAIAVKLTRALDASLAEVGPLFPVSGQWLNEAEFSATSPIDAFLKRFENLVEAGRRLFRVALVQAGEEHRELSSLEVMRLLEKLQLIDSVDAWSEIVAVRNSAAHEYAANADEAAEVLNEAHRAAARANGLIKALLQKLRERFPESSPKSSESQ